MATLASWKMEGGYEKGETPLSLAEKNNHSAIVEFLKKESEKGKMKGTGSPKDKRRFSPKVGFFFFFFF